MTDRGIFVGKNNGPSSKKIKNQKCALKRWGRGGGRGEEEV